MTLLRWKDEYGVGIEAVDHEHRSSSISSIGCIGSSMLRMPG